MLDDKNPFNTSFADFTNSTKQLPNLIIIALGIIAIFIIVATGQFPEFYELPGGTYIVSQTPIVSLETNQGIDGNFFLGCGSVQSEEYYYYYILEPDGGYALKKVRTDISKIYVDLVKDQSPHIDEIYVNSGNRIICDKKQSNLECIKQNPLLAYHTYNFHVPKGTIVERYSGMIQQ